MYFLRCHRRPKAVVSLARCQSTAYCFLDQMKKPFCYDNFFDILYRVQYVTPGHSNKLAFEAFDPCNSDFASLMS